MRNAAGTALAICFMLSACATNAVRLERATATGAAGERAVRGTVAVLGEVGQANRDKLIAVAALDPECELPTPLVAGPARQVEGICVPRGEPPVTGDFRLSRFDSRAFGPSLATIEALAAYLGAIDAILTSKRVDVGAELDETLGKLQGAALDISDIVGAGTPAGLGDDQIAAVAGALSLVSELAGEAHTVEELRRLETPERDARFAATITRMEAVNAGLAAILSEELQQQQLVLELTRMSGEAPAGDARAARREEMGLIERRENVAALEEGLARTLDALAASRADYVALLRDGDAPLTDEERALRASVAQKRVLGALSALAGLVRVF